MFACTHFTACRASKFPDMHTLKMSSAHCYIGRQSALSNTCQTVHCRAVCECIPQLPSNFYELSITNFWQGSGTGLMLFTVQLGHNAGLLHQGCAAGKRCWHDVAGICEQVLPGICLLRAAVLCLQGTCDSCKKSCRSQTE